MSENYCPDCHASWSNGNTCTDHFHMMLYWELDHQLWDVHHLMVLCYHIQHPALYSVEGLAGAKQQLVDFVEHDISTQQMRKQMRDVVDSGLRSSKITGTAENHGSHEHPVQWSMTCADVISAGIDEYYASVQDWAQSILHDLRKTGNIKSGT